MVAIEVKALNALRRRRVFMAWQNDIRPDFWSNSISRKQYREIERKYAESPPSLKLVTLSHLENWAETHFGREADKQKHIDLLIRMKKVGYDPKTDDVGSFLQRRGFESALNQGIELLDSTEGINQLGEIRDRIDGLVKLRSKASTRPRSFFKTAAKRLVPSRRGLVSTGISKALDTALGGGLGEGELGIFLGATNRGKTAMLCNLAAHAMKQGKPVVYFTLDDLSWKKIARRVDQILLGWNELQILSEREVYKKKMRAFRKLGYGDLKIFDFNDRMTTHLDIRAAVEQLTSEGEKPALVLVDYIDVLDSVDGKHDQQRMFLQACRALRRMGQENRFGVWTASQGNRQAIDSEEIKLSQMAGAIVKAKAGDVVLGMNQTEDERLESMMRLSVLKSRVSAIPDGPVWIATEWETMRMTGARDDD